MTEFVVMFKTERMKDIYSDAVNFVDGTRITAKEMFEIMYDAKEYDIREICAVIDRLWTDGFLKR